MLLDEEEEGDDSREGGNFEDYYSNFVIDSEIVVLGSSFHVPRHSGAGCSCVLMSF